MRVVGLCTGLIVASLGQMMAGEADVQADFATRTRAAFAEKRDRFLADTNDAEAAWQFGRACFNLAEIATNNTEKAAIAEQGVAASRQSIATTPALAPAHYYLALTLGQLADTRRNLGALKMVKEMEREFSATLDLDEHWDYAGPDRNLGLLYWQAPAVISIGSRSKARQHLRRAAELAPGYPENRLNLIEAYFKWGDIQEARREIQAVDELLPAARNEFGGEAWAFSWLDWDGRLSRASQKALQSPKLVGSPRQTD